MKLKIFKIWWTPLVLGISVMVAAAFLFAWLTEDIVQGDPITLIDQHIHDWFMAHTNPTITTVFSYITTLGYARTLYIITAVVGVILLWKRQWYWLFSLLFIVPGGLCLDLLIKNAVHRPRPSTDVFNVVLHSYSFPSAHAMGSTLMYGYLAALAYTFIPDQRWRNVTIGLMIFLIILISLTRVYLGFHFPTDVIAGIAAGTMWLLLCFMSTSLLFKKLRTRSR